MDDFIFSDAVDAKLKFDEKEKFDFGSFAPKSLIGSLMYIYYHGQQEALPYLMRIVAEKVSGINDTAKEAVSQFLKSRGVDVQNSEPIALKQQTTSNQSINQSINQNTPQPRLRRVLYQKQTNLT